MQSKFDLVIFDVDGTLIDGRKPIRANFNGALKAYGYAPVESIKIDGMIGQPLEDMYVKLSGVDEETAMELTREYRRIYSQTSYIGVELLAGVPDVLIKLAKSGIKIAIAANKSEAELPGLLEKIGIAKYFDLVVGRREGINAKPEPDMINYIKESTGISQDRMVMVGDTYLDIVASRAAGVRSIAVLTGVKLGIADKKMLIESRPDFTIDSLNELPGLIFE